MPSMHREYNKYKKYLNMEYMFYYMYEFFAKVTRPFYADIRDMLSTTPDFKMQILYSNAKTRSVLNKLSPSEGPTSP